MRTPPAPYGRREIACEGFPNQSGLGTVIPLGRWLEFAEVKADSFLGFAWVQGAWVMSVGHTTTFGVNYKRAFGNIDSFAVDRHPVAVS
jgi:hypothetical protein